MITKYMDYCLVCGKKKTDMHHLVYGNAKRKLADEDKLIAPCCRECHEAFHQDKAMQVMSHVVGQLLYERDRCAEGNTVDEARALFRNRYGVSYL